ncbi:MAG: hypothetical protein DWQ21_03485 [Bacteroidetes bacterium]|nr:MAG: hypothetical protein DWQ21_03485 [Bacteroidota bacterium]REK63870.1 MAG: hypothetical protein DWQ49_01890 [Bacteroidota bacterium]
MGMFGRSDDDDSVTYFDTDMDVNDSKIYKGQGALDRAIKDNFGGNKWRMASEIFNQGRKSGFQPYDEKDEYFKELLKRPFGGGAIPGSTQRLAGGLTMSMPRAFEPIITPGGGGGYQGKSTGQRLAGAAGGALSGAAAGSAVPGIGTALGAVLGGIGGFIG